MKEKITKTLKDKADVITLACTSANMPVNETARAAALMGADFIQGRIKAVVKSVNKRIATEVDEARNAPKAKVAAKLMAAKYQEGAIMAMNLILKELAL